MFRLSLRSDIILLLVLLILENDCDIQGFLEQVRLTVRDDFSISVSEHNAAKAGNFRTSWFWCLDIFASSHCEEVCSYDQVGSMVVSSVSDSLFVGEGSESL